MNTTKGRNVVVVGTQWGDEGKGKLVDWLTESFLDIKKLKCLPANHKTKAVILKRDLLRRTD